MSCFILFLVLIPPQSHYPTSYFETVNLKTLILKVKLGSLPPQASEDSFSDEDDDLKDRSLSSIVKETPRTGLPKQLLERLEKKMTKRGKKSAKAAGSLRIRRAQESFITNFENFV